MPVTPGVSAFQSAMMKRTFFWGVLEGLRKTVQLQLLQLYWPGHRLRFL